MSAAANRAAKLEQSNSEAAQSAVAEATETDRGMTPLMRAACEGLAGTVRMLLDRGAEVNAQRSDGFNALALAAFFGHSHVVWLLLENGADLAATGRSETPPERWADSRGFIGIAETLREARVREQLEVSNPSTSVIDEPARFSRSAPKEELPQAGDQGADLVIAGAVSKTTLATGSNSVANESLATISESRAEVLPSDLPEHPRQQLVVEQPLRVPRTLPEIEDPPLLVVPKFHPGSTFVARVTSSRNSLVALVLPVVLVCISTAMLLVPQIRKSLVERRSAAVSNSTNIAAEATDPVVVPGTNVSVAEAPSAPPEPIGAPAPTIIEEIKGETFAAVSSWSRSGTRTRKHRTVSPAVEFNQETVAEEKPKPAPLSVETSRSRSVISTPAGSTNEVSISPPEPLSIISGKPKSKVIQWP